jgi:hypothetical protein
VSAFPWLARHIVQSPAPETPVQPRFEEDTDDDFPDGLELGADRLALLDDVMTSLSAVASHPMNFESTRLKAISTMYRIASRYRRVVDLTKLLPQFGTKLGKGVAGDTRQLCLLCIAEAADASVRYIASKDVDRSTLLINFAASCLDASKRDPEVAVIFAAICEQQVSSKRCGAWLSTIREEADRRMPPAAITRNVDGREQTSPHIDRDVALKVLELFAPLQPHSRRDFTLLRTISTLASDRKDPRLDALLTELSRHFVDDQLMAIDGSLGSENADLALIAQLTTTEFLWLQGDADAVLERLDKLADHVKRLDGTRPPSIVSVVIHLSFAVDCLTKMLPNLTSAQSTRFAARIVDVIRVMPSSREEKNQRSGLWSQAPTLADTAADALKLLLN